ncbi:RNaseH domain-containing protein [Ferrovibrio sp.]|uniref:RNaseH domain-containing protein n=1 Tax=Ferrovibrio sp. TaxID=1917215 RepID=UPI003D0ADFA2
MSDAEKPTKTRKKTEVLKDLGIAAWSTEGLPRFIRLTRFKLPVEAQLQMLQWTEEKVGSFGDRGSRVLKRGLPEIMAWFVPDVAYIKHDYERGDAKETLSLYFIGDLKDAETTRRRVKVGLLRWLFILYPKKDAGLRTRIADTVDVDANWKTIDVSTAQEDHGGICGRPVDRLFWDAATAYAAHTLAGQCIQFRGGEARRLISRAGLSDMFNGIELVAFPPRSDDSSMAWSEVITVTTGTFPEKKGIYILAHPRIRNWGPVHRSTSYDGDFRSLEVFIPDGEGQGVHKHTTFDVGARYDRDAEPGENGKKPLEAVWKHDDSVEVIELLKTLTGQTFDTDQSALKPVIDRDGLWVMPRLGTNHGDRKPAGGTGIPWNDRFDIVTSLDKVLSSIGLKQSEPIKRFNQPRTNIQLPFETNEQREEDNWPKRRAALTRALLAGGRQTAVLDLYVLHRRDDTPEVMSSVLQEYLGPCVTGEGHSLQWEGLTINIRAAAAGVLSEALPTITLSDGDKEGRTEKAQREIRKLRRTEAFDESRKKMGTYIASFQVNADAIACAILEMPGSMRDDDRVDPFRMARQELAAKNILPQVYLIEDRPVGKSEAVLEKWEERQRAKYLAAMRDCFRMLGTIPVSDMVFLPAAITVLQKNETRDAGGYSKSFALPLAMRVNKGALECALPADDGQPQWVHYPNAVLRMLTKDYSPFSRGRQEENVAKFNTFFAAALKGINEVGQPSLVITEMETSVSRIPSLQNGSLTFDQLRIGGQTFTPADLPNLTLVRTSPDRRKQPHYFHDKDTAWPSGMFKWGDAARTLYALKSKPPTVSTKSHYAANISRHPVSGDNKVDYSTGRLSAQLDEFCVIFKQSGDDAGYLLSMVHKLRNVHTQYSYATSQPYPLHELRLLDTH